MSTVTRCLTCAQRWSGLRACHCAACHCTFSGVSAFDRHQRGGRCQHPAVVALDERDGVWRFPGPSESPWKPQPATLML
jgi:hypothetical protein